MIDLRQYFTPEVIAANWTEVYSNQIAYLHQSFFPSKKKAGLTLAWLNGEKGLPITLMPSAFDAKATFRDRVGFSEVKASMPFFREGYHIDETDRQLLMEYENSSSPYAVEILQRMFDDTSALIEGAMIVPERMAMQLLFPEGGSLGITIRANGVNYTYNYDTDGSWKTSNYTALTGGDLWSAPTTADPIKTLQKAKDAIREKTGVEVVNAIMNTATFNDMTAAASVKNRFLTVSGASTVYVTPSELGTAVSAATGLNFVLYDKLYRDESKNSHKFVPDGYVALVPAGPLGSMWYGTTPEEADLRGYGAEVSIVNTGVAISRELQQHPVNINIYASEIVLPSYERMNEVAVLKVK